MFTLKKLIGSLIMPLPFCLMLAAAGVLVVYFTGRKRLGYGMAGAAVVLLLVFSTPIVPGALLSSLESRYDPLDDGIDTADIQTILVLGGGHRADERHTASLQMLGESSLPRLIEGVRLYRNQPERLLVTSGHSRTDTLSNAERMAGAAMELGVPEERIRMHPLPRDTREEAVAMYEFIGEEPFILVTSASHMPRAMAHFRARGMDPVPAPTYIKVTRPDVQAFTDLFPSSRSLRRSERAIHEYVGLVWGRISN